MTFEWNNKKNEANKEKHGIAFEDAVFVFQDPFLLETADSRKSFQISGLCLFLSIVSQ